jgi:hypothetical protein
MFWPERTDTRAYLGSFETAIGKYDVYVYKDIWPGLLLQDGPEIHEYASMDIDTLVRLLEHGSYSPTTNRHGIVPLKYGWAYQLFLEWR